jgi:hypothetical protein
MQYETLLNNAAVDFINKRMGSAGFPADKRLVIALTSLEETVAAFLDGIAFEKTSVGDRIEAFAHNVRELAQLAHARRLGVA